MENCLYSFADTKVVCASVYLTNIISLLLRYRIFFKKKKKIVIIHVHLDTDLRIYSSGN